MKHESGYSLFTWEQGRQRLPQQPSRDSDFWQLAGWTETVGLVLPPDGGDGDGLVDGSGECYMEE